MVDKEMNAQRKDRLSVIALLHAESEGPGTLGEFLELSGAEVHTVRLYEGERLPSSGDGFEAVVSMGGPMNVYEEDRYPFLWEETKFLREVIESGVPVLGICLGSQMIAKACGARVRRAPAGELGWSEIRLTPAGLCDELFKGLPERMQVLQWHEDTFEVPTGGTLLATSEVCPSQAFRVRNAYGLQFHIEVTQQMIEEWFDGLPLRAQILDCYDVLHHCLSENATKIYTQFAAIARASAAVRCGPEYVE